MTDFTLSTLSELLMKMQYTLTMEVDFSSSIQSFPKDTNILIVGGLGEMGFAFTKLFVKEGARVSMVDVARPSSEKKRELDKLNIPLFNEVPKHITEYDVVFLSVPPEVTIDTAKAYIPKMKMESVLIEITSVNKSEIIYYLKSLAFQYNINFVSIHPMFGGPIVKAMQGWNVIMIKEEAERNNYWYEKIKDFFQQQGAFIKETTAQQHDMMVSVTQTLTHFLFICFLETLRDFEKQTGYKLKDIYNFCTPPFESLLALSLRFMNLSFKTVLPIQLHSKGMTVKRQFSQIVNDLAQRQEELSQIIENLSDFIGIKLKNWGKITTQGFFELSGKLRKKLLSSKYKMRLFVNKYNHQKRLYGIVLDVNMDRFTIFKLRKEEILGSVPLPYIKKRISQNELVEDKEAFDAKLVKEMLEILKNSKSKFKSQQQKKIVQWLRKRIVTLTYKNYFCTNLSEDVSLREKFYFSIIASSSINGEIIKKIINKVFGLKVELLDIYNKNDKTKFLFCANVHFLEKRMMEKEIKAFFEETGFEVMKRTPYFRP